MVDSKTFRESFDRDGFARKLKEYRLEREWTLRQMANVIGIDIRTIWNLENGKAIPHELTYRKLIKALPGILEAEVA